MADELGDLAAFELDIGSAALVLAIVDGCGLKSGGDGFKPGEMVGVEEVGHDQIPLDFELADALASGKGGPVAVVCMGAGHEISSLCWGYRYDTVSGGGDQPIIFDAK